MKHLLIAGLSAFALGAPAFAAEQAEALIETTADAVTAMNSAASSVIVDAMDLDAIARFTLGRYGRTLDDDQFAKFRVALRDLIVSTYDKNVGEIAQANVVILGSTDRNERDSVVRTRIERPGHDALNVNWRVIKRNGEWAVVDVEVYGLWLAIEQRAQFAAILDRPGANIDTLISEISGG